MSNGDEDDSPLIPFDRIRVDFDINTSQDNIIDRFEENHIREFFDISSKWHADFSLEIVSFILGR
jgi:hypothetical protein